MDIREIANLMEDTQQKGGPSVFILKSLGKISSYMDRINHRLISVRRRLDSTTSLDARFREIRRKNHMNQIKAYENKLANALKDQNRQVDVDAWAFVNPSVIIAGATPHMREGVSRKVGVHASGIREVRRDQALVAAGAKFKELRAIYENWWLARDIPEPDAVDIDIFNIDRFGEHGGKKDDVLDNHEFQDYIYRNHPELHKYIIDRNIYNSKYPYTIKTFYIDIVTFNPDNVIEIIPKNNL